MCTLVERESEKRPSFNAGEPPATDYSRKPIELFEQTQEGRNDLVVHEVLRDNGFSFATRPEDAPQGFSNIDLVLSNGDVWEVKSPDLKDGGSKRYVESSVRKCKRQFAKYYQMPGEDASHVRLVFSNIARDEDDDWAFEKLRFECDRHGIDAAYFIGKDHRLRKAK